MGPAVVFDHVSKKFRKGERHDSLRDLLPAIVRGALSSKQPSDALRAHEFWALHNVTFEVDRGRALGIIGNNGAGKSTTLKLLTRILRPTQGHCAVHGRMGALIEVAAGFHPDLTGRENVYLQGAIMGMRRAEIANQFDAIVAFSGLSEFIDTPIKRYSSGMNARLGFSIAAHLNPEVLIIDEVLAVGDGAFQQKCFERIQSLKRSGVTLVFVSHNLAAVEALCDEALVLSRGEMIYKGDPFTATKRYLQPGAESGSLPQSAEGFEREGTGAVQITGVRLMSQGKPVSKIDSGGPLDIEVDVLGVTAPKEVVIRISVVDPSRVMLYGENGSVKMRPFVLQPGESATCRITIESVVVPEGRYSITVAAHSAFTQDIYDWHEAAYPFEVALARDTTRIGLMGFATTWTLVSPPAPRIASRAAGERGAGGS